MWRAPTPVVVCVDGSDAGLRAATWAVREAVNRDVPLRIVHVIEVRDVDAEKPEAYGDRLRLDAQYAESALREATAAVEATEIPVKLETEILWGPVESALIEESSHATMICLGTAEIACADGAPLSATAAAIARNAQCPVAIIGKQREPAAARPGWILVGVEGRADNEPVIEAAMEEARLRRLPILAVDIQSRHFGDIHRDDIGQRIDRWTRCYPDVVVRPVVSPHGIPQVITGDLSDRIDDLVEMIVVGRVDGASVARIIGSGGHSILVVH